MKKTARKKEKKFFVLFIWGDVEPHLHGPYQTEEKRDNKVREIRRKEGVDGGGIYRAEVSKNGNLTVSPYSGGFFND